ncbi:ABC transporter ATP-binding protein/permease [bacterium]|nr:ABC transporter ATP-binding protein/permease [bacterium]
MDILTRVRFDSQRVRPTMVLGFHDRKTSRHRYLDYLTRRRQELKDQDKKDEDNPRRRIQEGRGFGKLIVEFWRLLPGHRSALVAALFGLSVARLLSLTLPASTKFVIDYVLLNRPLPADFPKWIPLPESPQGKLVAMASLVLIISVVSSMIQLWARWKATLTTQRLQVRIRRKLFDHAARLPLHKVHDIKSGGVSSLLREDAGGVGDLIFNLIFNPWRAIIQLLGGIVILIWVDWRLLLGALAVLPIVYWNHQLWVRWIRPLYRDIKRQRQDIDSQTTEAFAGMRVVRAFGRQRRESSRFVGESHLMSRQEINVWWTARTIEVVWDMLLPFASGLLMLYGGMQVLNGQLSPGDLMMFLVYLTMLLEPIAVIATSATQFQSNLAAFDRVLDILGEPRELSDHQSKQPAEAELFDGPIRIENISFRYPKSDEFVLNDIDLEIEPGSLVTLVGRSGSGKTTLCNLVARFHDPTVGRITLSGIDLRDIHVETYRKFLGIVEQEVFLFDGTVAENIGYAVRETNKNDVVRAAKIANAHEFIMSLPEGYDTRIGERGVRLSGGQRQRLAIARAVLADPKLFILDEATSNLDSESEQLIQQSLAELMRGRTSIVIAHRLSTVRNADRILVMEAGRIVESGTHSELMSSPSRYREMVELQQMDFADESLAE